MTTLYNKLNNQTNFDPNKKLIKTKKHFSFHNRLPIEFADISYENHKKE